MRRAASKVSTLAVSASGVRVALSKVIQGKRKVRSERKDDEPLADYQRKVAKGNEFDEYYQDCGISDTHAEERQVTRRLCVVNAPNLKNDIHVQGDVGEEC
jgi:hypothetical protein